MTARTWLKWGAIVLLVVLTAWLAASAAVAAIQARQALGDLQRLQALADAPSADALPVLRRTLADLEGHLAATQSAGRPFLWLAPGFGWLPEIGPTVRDAPALLEMARELAGAGRQALDALSPVTDLLAGRGQGDLLARAVPALAAAAPDLKPVETRMERAVALRAQIRGPLHPRLAGPMQRLDLILPLAGPGLKAVGAAPSLLGADGPKSYLILAQNNHELRPTGGFISGVGIVRLDNGRLATLKLSDSYSVDNLSQPHPLPPAPLAEQMGIQLLFLRDSNWSPDFPTSALTARSLYQQDQGVATDGAIALDLEAVRLLVGALEPLEVPGITGPVTGANVIEKMKQAWASPVGAQGNVEQAATSDWWLKRKDFMGDLVTVALGKLQGGGEINLTALARALLEMLNGRHLQIAVDDPTLAALLADQGWDGALRPQPGQDFLAVVDSNVGFNKTNAAIRQQIAYRVGQADGGLEATLTLTYTHTAPPLPADQPCDRTPRYGDSYDDMIRRCHWDYLRVYVPLGSELLASEGLNGPSTGRGEGGTTVFAGGLVLRPGEQGGVTLRYRLPADLSVDPYRLFVRKQAGVLAPPLRVEVGPCRWQTDLARDRIFECPGGIGRAR